MGDETTSATLVGSRVESASLRLVIIDSGQLSFFALPARGVVVIGRSQSADVRIEDGRVSREHARLHVGERVEIEDLGSANGTLLQNRPLSPWTRVPMAPAEAVSIGGAVLMVQPGDVPNEPSIGTPPPKRDTRPVTQPPAGVVVEDEQMKRLYEMAGRIAKSRINVLILGETGTGKELLAESIHRRSERAAKTFLCLNCAAFNETLLESELFGHVRGAFTGAQQAKPGLLESAAGGTVFLDELGEMSSAIQAKLLRVLETRQVMRVGGSDSKAIDVRFVSATNCNLATEVARGRFRRDLYFRLNTVTLQLPPLRERQREILPLARHFIIQCSAEAQRVEAPTLSAEAILLLQGYDFPGNVRELRNAIQRALVLSGAEIEPAHLALEREPAGQQGSSASAGRASAQPQNEAASKREFRAELAELERRRILEALEAFAGNQTRAAEHLGISRRTLLKRLDEYGSSRPRKRAP